MIWRLPHPVLGIVVFLVVWVGGATLIGFGAALPEMIGLSLLATAAFLLPNRRRASERVTPS
jgi:hypothetical protein